MEIPFLRGIVDMLHIVGDTADFSIKPCYFLISLGGIELEDTRHLDFPEPDKIFIDYLPEKGRFEWFQQSVDTSDGRLHVDCLLYSLVLVDPLLNEYFLKRGEQLAFTRLGKGDFKLAMEYVARAVHRVTQQFADRQKLRFVVTDHTTVR